MLQQNKMYIHNNGRILFIKVHYIEVLLYIKLDDIPHSGIPKLIEKVKMRREDIGTKHPSKFDAPGEENVYF